MPESKNILDSLEELVERQVGPSLVILGIGEAGQRILKEVLYIASELGIVKKRKNTGREALIRVYRKQENGKIEIMPVMPSETKPGTVTNKPREPKKADLNDMLGQLYYTEGKNASDSPTLRPEQNGEAIDVDDVVQAQEKLNRFSPVVSPMYGISAIRIDLDERTLNDVANEILSEIDSRGEGVPLPPGLSIIANKIDVDDPVLKEKVVLVPERGANGKSGAVYSLLLDKSASLLLDILGLRDRKLSQRSYYVIMIYRIILLIHGLVGSGAGTAAAILQAINNNFDKDVIDATFKLNLAVIPQAKERGKVDRDEAKWVAVLKWNLNNIVEFLEEGVLDTSFIVDLDFALLQHVRDNAIEEKKDEAIRKYHEFILKILKNKANEVYQAGKIEEFIKETSGKSFLEADLRTADRVIAQSVEPVLEVMTRRDIKFAVGGSSLDEQELKGLLSGRLVLPMVSTMDILNLYLEHTECQASPRVCANATLLLPAIHGMLAPVEPKLVDDLLVIINKKALDLVKERFGYVPMFEEVTELLDRIFGVGGVVLLSHSQDSEISTIIYALTDEPDKYFTEIVEKKWGRPL